MVLRISILLTTAKNNESLWLDQDSVFVRMHAFDLYTRAMKQIRTDPLQALSSLDQSFSAHPSHMVALRLAWLHEMSGNNVDTEKWYSIAGSLTNPTVNKLSTAGVAAHYSADYSTALAFYNQILEIDGGNVDAIFHKGVTYQYLGDIQIAADMYEQSYKLSDQLHFRSVLNLASLHHKFGAIPDAIRWYQTGLALFNCFINISDANFYFHHERAKIVLNLGFAHFQLNAVERVS